MVTPYLSCVTGWGPHGHPGGGLSSLESYGESSRCMRTSQSYPGVGCFQTECDHFGNLVLVTPAGERYPCEGGVITVPGEYEMMCAGEQEMCTTEHRRLQLQSDFTNDAPAIGSIVPVEAPDSGGTTVRIYGHGFGALDAQHEVLFCGDVLLDMHVVSPRLITGTTPAGAPGSCDVSIEIYDDVISLAPGSFTFRPSHELPPGGNFIDWLRPINGYANSMPVTCLDYPYSSDPYCAQDQAGVNFYFKIRKEAGPQLLDISVNSTASDSSFQLMLRTGALPSQRDNSLWLPPFVGGDSGAFRGVGRMLMSLSNLPLGLGDTLYGGISPMLTTYAGDSSFRPLHGLSIVVTTPVIANLTDGQNELAIAALKPAFMQVQAFDAPIVVVISACSSCGYSGPNTWQRAYVNFDGETPQQWGDSGGALPMPLDGQYDFAVPKGDKSSGVSWSGGTITIEIPQHTEAIICLVSSQSPISMMSNSEDIPVVVRVDRPLLVAPNEETTVEIAGLSASTFFYRVDMDSDMRRAVAAGSGGVVPFIAEAVKDSGYAIRMYYNTTTLPVDPETDSFGEVAAAVQLSEGLWFFSVYCTPSMSSAVCSVRFTLHEAQGILPFGSFSPEIEHAQSTEQYTYFAVVQPHPMATLSLGVAADNEGIQPFDCPYTSFYGVTGESCAQLVNMGYSCDDIETEGATGYVAYDCTVVRGCGYCDWDGAGVLASCPLQPDGDGVSSPYTTNPGTLKQLDHDIENDGCFTNASSIGCGGEPTSSCTNYLFSGYDCDFIETNTAFSCVTARSCGLCDLVSREVGVSMDGALSLLSYDFNLASEDAPIDTGRARQSVFGLASPSQPADFPSSRTYSDNYTVSNADLFDDGSFSGPVMIGFKGSSTRGPNVSLTLTGSCTAPESHPEACMSANSDCAGGWSSCSAACSRTYVVLQPVQGFGAPCEAADGTVAGCRDGACSPGPEMEPEHPPAYATVALNDTHHLAWDGDVVEYVNETHHIAHDTDVDVTTMNLSTTSTVMTHEEHNITFIPGGPAGTVAINETHHITSTGDVIESLNSTHHIGSGGSVTSNVEGNLTREFHGLTDEHLDNHTTAGSTHDLVHLYHPGLADSGWLATGEPEMEPEMEHVAAYATVALNDTHHLAWDGDVVEYVNETHHIAHDTVANVTSMNIIASVVLDIALESIVAGSAERAAFEGAFMTDMASALGIAEDRVRLLLT